jgi:uncharacterized protein (TIGR00730 family)
MSEFVEGFTFLARVQRSVTFFGSARLPTTHPYYQLARQLGQRLARQGYTIDTGGGPGIMQAGNQGACDVDGDSVGLNIQLPHEQRINPYVRRSMSFHYFFSRKVMLDFSAEAYVFFPGGFGTLNELFEVLTLVQTGKMERCVPLLLIGSDFWAPLCDWLRGTLLEKMQTITPHDLTIWTLTDDLDEYARDFADLWSTGTIGNSGAFDPAPVQLTYAKVLVVDHTVITGSYNFSRSAELNAENILIIENAALADAYSAYIDHLMTKYQYDSVGDIGV